jgi:hypothetical protein
MAQPHLDPALLEERQDQLSPFQPTMSGKIALARRSWSKADGRPGKIIPQSDLGP